MAEIYAKCGATCSRCPAYRANVHSDADRQKCSDGWHRYLGVRLNPQRCYCDGCQTPDAQAPQLVYGRRGCSIRQCAVFNGVQTCAHCGAYPCDAVRHQFSFDAGSRQSMAERLGQPVPDDDYGIFIEPYELHKHLEAIRVALNPAQIIPPTRPKPIRARVAAFPDDLSVSGPERDAVQDLYRLLCTVRTAPVETYVQQLAFKKRRSDLFKILWAFGRYGAWDRALGEGLAVESDSPAGQRPEFARLVRKRDNTLHSPTQADARLFQGIGVSLQHNPLDKKRWSLRLAFDDRAGGAPAIGALRSYVRGLASAYADDAPKRFTNADMGIYRRA